MSDRRPRESARRDGFGSDTIGRSPAGRAQLPLLDRLMDAEPAVLSDPPISAAKAMDGLRASIRHVTGNSDGFSERRVGDPDEDRNPAVHLFVYALNHFAPQTIT